MSAKPTAAPPDAWEDDWEKQADVRLLSPIAVLSTCGTIIRMGPLVTFTSI